MEILIGRSVLALWEGDITKFSADAIVNAANSALAGGGGVDGAIHRAAGAAMRRDLDAIQARAGGCPTGSAVITGAGNLPARFVIHAVGPVYCDGRHGEPELLASCYRTALRLAEENGAMSIAFPSISTGVYGYPLEAAAQLAVQSVAAHLKRPECTIERVTLVAFGLAAFEIYRKVARSAHGPAQGSDSLAMR
jgi:O-acetyl-ADP-ribose deacetylase (regulator of RNase III)